MKQILVYQNLNNNTYYYKIVKFSFSRYELNSINAYNHKLILIISDYDFKKRKSLRNKLIKFLNRLLEKNK